MGAGYYKSRLAELEPYFTPSTSIDDREKACAFLVGVLLGALFMESGGGGAATGRNLLPVGLFDLSGPDLPELCEALCRALAECSGGRRTLVRAIAGEARHLATSLADGIELDAATTTYFLLYGCSACEAILRSRR